MQKRDVVKAVLDGRRPPYVPWSIGFTKEAAETLQLHYGADALENRIQNHFVKLGSDIGFFDDLGDDRRARRLRRRLGPQRRQGHRHRRGTACFRSRPWPASTSRPAHPRFFADIPPAIARSRTASASSRRLLPLRARLDAARHGEPDDGLLRPSGLRARAARRHRRLQHRPGARRRWSTTLTPSTSATTGASSAGCRWGRPSGATDPSALRRMYGAVREAGKFVMIHSCGDVDELFDDLIDPA